MKNITTPRTLAECQWVTGYHSADLRENGRKADKVIAWIAGAVAVWGVIGYLIQAGA